jgi:phosphatidylinositol-4-phosphate 3-kinase
MAVGPLRSLPRGAGLGRSNVKQVAEKRLNHIQVFLDSLFQLADEISHSNLVYTFFHPLLRDEEQHLDDEYEKKMSARGTSDVQTYRK